MGRVLPIFFITEMVQAILAGKKTETRRLIKPRYKQDERGFIVMTNMGTGERYLEKVDKEETIFDSPRYINPPYQPGDILYVRETCFYESHMEALTVGEPDLPNGRYSHRYIYKADDPDYPVNIGVGATGWKPSIHMPKEAARIWLKVKKIRVERLQDIDDDGVVAEGLQIGDPYDELWNSTIKKKKDLPLYGWYANPWVWVVEFERCEKPKGWASG